MVFAFVTPNTGSYTAPQRVVVSPVRGAVLHYTVTGNEPTEADPVVPVDGVFLLEETTTLRVKGWRTGWIPSVTSIQTYTLDQGPDETAPTISAIVSTPPGPSGWTNASVTVSFACADAGSGIASCSSPVAIESDGAGFVVTGSATDTAGNSASTSVTINRDATAPLLSVGTAPPESTTDATVTVTATVTDALSGVGSGRCNGAPVTISGDTLSCTVALSRGANTILMHAQDLAGNGVSAGFRVMRSEPRSSLMITPTSRALLIGETTTVKVVDQTGLEATDVTWTSSEPQVAAITVGDEGYVLTALSGGETTIEAAVNGLTAEAVVRVFAGVALPSSEPKWTFTSGFGPFETFPAYQFTPSDPAQFALDVDGDHWIVRALSADGEQLWTEPIPSTLNNFADVYGGVVSASHGAAVDFVSRVGGATGGPPWEYYPNGQIGSLLVGTDPWAQASDGTIFLLELRSHAEPSRRMPTVVALDGRTGAVKSRTPLPTSHECSGEPFLPLSHTSPFVGADGAAYVLSVTFRSPCPGGPLPSAGQSAPSPYRLYLLRVDSSGASAVFSLRHYEEETYACYGFQCVGGWSTPSAWLIPDGRGGVLISGVDSVNTGEIRPWTMRWSNGSATEWAASAGGLGLRMIGSDDTVLSSSGYELEARDFIGGALKWSVTLDDNELPLQASDNGSALLYNHATGALTVVENGTRTSTDAYPVLRNPVRTAVDELSGGFVDPVTNTIAIGTFQTRARNDLTLFPTAQRQNATRTPETGIFAKGQVILATQNHVAIRIVPTDQKRWIDPVLGKPGIFKQHGGRLNGKYFGTIGGGSTDEPCDGFLYGQPNRRSDVRTPDSHKELLQYPPILEDTKIDLLLELETHYQDNLPYSCTPDFPFADDTYNSAGFARGLLDAADIPLPSFPFEFPLRYIGWTKPVPVASFQSAP